MPLRGAELGDTHYSRSQAKKFDHCRLVKLKVDLETSQA
jgi:hypothetical protein